MNIRSSILSLAFGLFGLAIATSQSTTTGTPYDHDGNQVAIIRTGDSIEISGDVLDILTNAELRDSLYPEVYELTAIPYLLEKGEMKAALWYLVNCYNDEPYLAKAIAEKLGQLGIGKSNYINAFYTYIYGDPEVMAFDSGTPYVASPERLNEKLISCRNLTLFAEYSLEQKRLKQ